MASAKITLIGMSKWFAMSGSSLWEDIKLPTGIDKDTLVDTIILRGGEFEVLYSGADFFKQAVKHFFNQHYRTFDKWYIALQLEYNPIENYDRIEEFEDKNVGKSSDKSNGNGTSTDKVSAYDSDTLRTSDENSSTSTNKTDTTMENTNTRKGRIHGNIGVTTSQQMLQSELDIAKFDIYAQIADLFCDELTIMVYS